MRTIIINDTTKLDKRLITFLAWVDKQAEFIAKKEPKDLWEGFTKTLIYDNLNELLCENQGYICCYCGSPIRKPNHSGIEHLVPKSKFKDKLFDYNNLFASCGSENYGHKGSEVAYEYNVKEEDKQRFNNNLDSLKNYLKQLFHITETDIYVVKNNKIGSIIGISKFPISQKLIIVTPKPKRTCNEAKLDILINFDLKDSNLASYFSYDNEGKIVANDFLSNKIEIQNDLDETLQLNCTYLKDRRATIKSIIEQEINIIFENYANDRQNIIDALENLYQSYSTINEFKELEPYCFVKTTTIKTFIPS